MANPNIAKLKKKATDFEQKKQFDRALSLYIQLLEEAGRDLDDSDLQLFNRVGDLLQRQGNVSEALAYYEKAVDVYAERGFLNNAIALCNKVLRQSPARTAVYYKLGKISASKGFKSDAKKNFLEYADRMQKAGHVDEAFRALKEFADLCPDQDDIRLMLAEWLNKENRKSEAIEQLEVLYGKLESEGRAAEARATIDRITAIDPTVTPRQSGQWQAQKTNDLIFLDLGGHEPPTVRRNAEPVPEPSAPPLATPPAAARIPALEGLILTFDPEVEEAMPAGPVGIIGFEATASDGAEADHIVDVGALAGLEAGGTPIDAIVDPSLDSLVVQQAESWTTSSEPIPLVSGLETPRISLSGAHPALSPLLDEPPLSGREFGALTLDVEVELTPLAERTSHDFAIPSDLPLLETDGASIDLLSVMRTPFGVPSIADATVAGNTSAIDLLALPPLGGEVPGGSQASPPVTGSASPLDLDAAESLRLSSTALSELLRLPGDPVEAITGAAGDTAVESAADAAAHDAPPVEGERSTAAIEALAPEVTPETEDVDVTRPRADRDTSELMAQDVTARRTDEILIVPSEVIDEETKRSLRLEFSLDGDETPDAWVEAALAAPDDLSLDRFLTPLGVPAIQDAASSGTSALTSPVTAVDWDGVDDASATEDHAVGERAAAEPTAEEAAVAEHAVAEHAVAEHAVAEHAPAGLEATREGAAHEGAAHEGAAHEGAAHEIVADAGDVRQLAPVTSGTDDVADVTGPDDGDGATAVPASDDQTPFDPALAHDVLAVDVHAEAAADDDVAPDVLAVSEVVVSTDVDAGDAEPVVSAASYVGIEGTTREAEDETRDDAREAAREHERDLGREHTPEDAAVDAPPEMSVAEAAPNDGPAPAAGSAESPYDIPPLSLESIGATTPQAVGGDVSLDADDLAALGAAGWDAPGGQGEIDLLDELTPPFMRHEDALDDIGRASALDVDELRALVVDREGRDELPAGIGGQSAAELEAAFRERAVDLPLLDVEDLITPSDGSPPVESLHIEPFSVESLLSQAPSFGDTEPPSFLPESLNLSDEFSNERSDERSSEPARDTEQVTEPEHEPVHEPTAEAAESAALAAGSTDEWPADAAPEVLIDGEWRDEHMGDLVSGEVSAIVGPGADRPNRHGQRFDDLSAALLWPPLDGEGSERSAPSHASGASDAFFSRMHTPRSTLSFGGVEAQLRRRLELDPGNLILRRQLGEALLDQGDREEGLLELDFAMRGFEQANDLESARGVADIVLRVVPASVRHHQKRVEYAVRSNDRVRLVEAYVELADSLFRSGEPEKARVVYSRVLELSPGNGRARFALGLLSPDEEQGIAAAPRPASGAIPMSPNYVVTLFDRKAPAAGATADTARAPATTASISAEIPIVSDSLFVLPSASPARPGDGATTDGASTIDVGDMLTQERELSGALVDSRAAVHAQGDLDVARESEHDAESSEDRDADADASVTPFPSPSLDDEIDAAFATPPVVEAAIDEGILGAPTGADYDFAGTPPLGAAALATPFSSDESPLAASLTPTVVPALRSAPLPSSAVKPANPTPVSPTPAVPASSPVSDNDFVDLGSWLREDEPIRTTRMVAAEATPTGDEQADFDEMLLRFKQGVAANVDEEDYDSHYDLGVAYKEMGLTDEAIAEFQKALRGDSHRVRSYEALGQCFVEKGQLQVAITLLRRATETTGADDQQLVGVLFLLGYASEVLARHADALGYYQRVFAVDIEFRDVAQRVAAMEHVTQ